MIVTDLEHVAQQSIPFAGFRKALAFLQQSVGQTLEDGQVAIDGDRVYALIQSYETKPAGDTVRFEGHHKYIDIQYVAAGEEVMGWAMMDRITNRDAYSEATDAWHGTLSKAATTPVFLGAGDLVILFPTDAHAPKMAANGPVPVKKIVIKVAIED
jgi:biofilm protein TabA